MSSSNLNIEDHASIQVHLKGIEEELKRADSQDTVLLPFFRSTFGERRLFVLNDATSMKEIQDCYPAISLLWYYIMLHGYISLQKMKIKVTFLKWLF